MIYCEQHTPCFCISVSFIGAQTAGNVNKVRVISRSQFNVNSVTDSNGNIYCKTKNDSAEYAIHPLAFTKLETWKATFIKGGFNNVTITLDSKSKPGVFVGVNEYLP